MKKTPLFLMLVVVGFLGALAPAFAAPETGQDAPIDISAQESLEFYEATGLYVARGQARAVRGNTTIEADLLTAHRREGSKTQNTSGDLDRLTAEGNVIIHDEKQKIIGQQAVYDMDKKIFKVTGDNLKYLTGSDVVTARDSLEYYEDRSVAVARGKALALHEGSRIEADIMSATFGNNPSGQMEMKKMMAQGNVVIVTKDGNVSRSKRAVYDVKRNVAVLLEDVRIKQGETLLAGDEAEVDFKSGQSKLLNSGSGRVRVLLPSSGAKKKEASP